jgi:hypothetical protein
MHPTHDAYRRSYVFAMHAQISRCVYESVCTQ